MSSRNSSHRPAWRATALAALLLIGSATAWSAVDPRASRFYEDALTRYEKKDVSGAIVQLKNALQIDKNMLPVQVLLGKALLANADVVAAQVAFDEALRLGVNRAEVVLPLAETFILQGKQPELVADDRFAPGGLPAGLQAQLLLKKAVAYSDIGDPRAALKALDDARALDPGAPESWLIESPIRIRARQFREAGMAVDKALALAPELPEGWYQRGSIAHVQNELPAALAAYDKALALNPQHVEALVARAGLLLDLQRGPDAERDLATLARAAPREPRAAYLKALLADRAGDAAAARAALTRVTALLDPVPIGFMRYRPQLLMLAGLAHYGLGEREKAKPFLEAAQRVQPGSAVSKLLAQIYIAESNIDRAIEALEGYLRAQPNDSQAVALLASAHMSQGRYARATQLMQDALRSNDTPQLRTVLGLSLSGAGRKADAITELEAAWRKDPGQTTAAAALAGLYMQRGDFARAVTVSRTLVAAQPANIGFHNLLGMALARSGDAAGARKAFERALQIDPTFAPAQLNLARIDINSGAYDAALGRLNTVLKADERNVDALLETGVLHARRGQTADAQRWLEKAFDFSGPADLRAGLALVEFHLRGARTAQAIEVTKRLSAKAPDDYQVVLATAKAQLAGGDLAAARSALTRATALADYDPARQVEIALLQLAASNDAGAAYSLEKALGEQPDLLPALALSVDVAIRQGDLAKAEQRARQIAAKYPKQAIGISLLGDVAAARGQWPAAVDAYRRAHQAEPGSESLLRLFRALSASQAEPAAVAAAEQWLRSHPHDVRVRKTLGDAYARRRNYAGARGAYEAALKDEPGDVEAANNLANVLILLKDPGALAVAEGAMARNPGVPFLIGTAGWAAYHAGQPDRALQLLRDARLRDPANRDTRYFLAVVLAQTGRRAEARSELESALQGHVAFANAGDADALLQTLK